MTWLLAIDFGTSNTAAAHATWDAARGTGGAASVVPLTHAGNLLPSVAYIGMTGEVQVGQSALNAASSDVFGLVPAPKRLVTGAGALPPRAITAEDVIGAVLLAALDKARSMHSGTYPQFLVLTHPEAWSGEQRGMLAAAAERVGIPRHVIKMTSEPRAAVRFYGGPDTVGRNAAQGHHVAVFDFGGGTLDVAVLHQTARGHEVVAARGDNALGGRNLDARIREWVEAQLEDSAPQILEALLADPNSGANRTLAREIREAKEVLSDSQSATIAVSTPVGEKPLHLTRREFAEIIDPELDRALDLLNDTLADAARKGMRPQSLEAVYLTGGSSRIPAVHAKVQQIAPMATLDDPKTVVARGAVQILLDSLEAEATAKRIQAARAAKLRAQQQQAARMQQMQRMQRPAAGTMARPVGRPVGRPVAQRSGPVPAARPSQPMRRPSGPVQRPAQTSRPVARPAQRPPQRRPAPPPRKSSDSGSGVITFLLVVLLLLSIAVVGYMLMSM